MILELVGSVAVLGVTAFLMWERNDMGVTRVHAALRTMKATDIRISRAWFDSDRDTMTYDVEYTAADGTRKENSCKVSGADDQIYWLGPL